MKISRRQIRQIISEELRGVLSEGEDAPKGKNVGKKNKDVTFEEFRSSLKNPLYVDGIATKTGTGEFFVTKFKKGWDDKTRKTTELKKIAASYGFSRWQAFRYEKGGTMYLVVMKKR